MKYWIRTTHDFNNETRKWEFRESLSFILDSPIETQSVCGIDAVPRGHWATLLEIVEENKIYYEKWKNDPLSCGIDPSRLDQKIILKDLELMEQLGLVKSKTTS